ncbi:glutaredoxin-like protein NrdH [Arcanobacterium bovis]
MITIYTKDNCPQCAATKRQFDKSGVQYNEINLDTNPEAVEQLKAMGYREVPVVFSGLNHWSGFRPELIKSAIRNTQMEHTKDSIVEKICAKPTHESRSKDPAAARSQIR